MEDLLKRASLGRVAKYYCSKSLSIQVAVAWKDAAAKFRTNFWLHPRKLDDSVRCLVSIEEFRCGKDLVETFAERAFTRGNSARDSDCRHLRISPRRDAFGKINMEALFHFRCAEG